MSALRISLYGKFSIRHNAVALDGFEVGKVQELFCYLLIHRHEPHYRERLANLLWEESAGFHPRRNLRKTLWQLQRALKSSPATTGKSMLLVGPDWVQINPAADYWLDIAAFERAYELAQGKPGETLEQGLVQKLERAATLYNSDLLLGWYQDWCLFERERLQRMYMIMLDKLMRHCQAHGSIESGLAYGTRILSYDGARERTHRCLMRLYYLAGDRTEALRQYERCAAKLRQELDVEPDQRTVALYEQIRADQLPAAPLVANGTSGTPETTVSPSLGDLLASLKQLKLELSANQRRVQQKIDAIEKLLSNKQR